MDVALGSCVVIKDSFSGIEGVAVAGMTVLGFAGAVISEPVTMAGCAGRAGIMCLAIWRRYLNCCFGFNGS